MISVILINIRFVIKSLQDERDFDKYPVRY
jgi:hypothetical protein